MIHQRYVLFALIVGSILVGLTVQSACVSAFAQFAIPDTRVAGLLGISTLAALASGGVSFFIGIRTPKIVQFTDEVIGELVTVTWPTRDETVRASTTVVLTTLFVAAVLAFYDLIWKSIADMILFTEA